MAIRQKGHPRPAATYRGYIRNNTTKFDKARFHRRDRWKELGLGKRLAERRAANY